MCEAHQYVMWSIAIPAVVIGWTVMGLIVTEDIGGEVLKHFGVEE